VGQAKKFELWDEQQWHNSRKSWLTEEANSDGESDDIPTELQSLAL
jgi:DNA-binding transcriptional regulator/RsmH inhibitor MraZ